MNGRVITSLTNPTVKAARALHLRKERDETGLFVAEGLKVVTEGVETGHAPKVLLYGQDASDHPLLIADAGKHVRLSWLTQREGYRLLPLEDLP